jgi:hypothetical protein
MAKKKPTKPVPHVGLEDLKRYFMLDQKRLHLNRLAKAVLTEMAELEKTFTELVHAVGGPEKCVVRCEYRLMLKGERVNVKWKDHFIKAKGAEKAAKIIAAQPMKDVLVVEPPPKKETVKKAA